MHGSRYMYYLKTRAHYKRRVEASEGITGIINQLVGRCGRMGGAYLGNAGSWDVLAY